MLGLIFGTSIGRLAIAGLLIAAALAGLVHRAEQRGAAHQIVEQQRVDSAAVTKANMARKKARAASRKAAKAKKPEANDGWRRD